MDCRCRSFQLAIGVLGRPWTALLLGLLQPGPLRFGQIEDRAKGVGAKMLSLRLKELSELGLVRRRVDPGPPVRVAYELTEAGSGFGRVASAMERWGRRLGAAERRRHPSRRPARSL